MSGERLDDVLRDRFGLEEFRPGQERVVRALLDGRDVMALMPTGSGKSLAFQLASQVLPGVTLVVSPLIALMQDQVESMVERGIEAESVSGSQGSNRAEQTMDRLEQGDTKLLYITPERLGNDDFMAGMDDLEVSLVVVDEAHCIVEWGYDFRPAYLGLEAAVRRLGRPPILATTATATPWVRDEIAQRLALDDPLVVVHGNDRPNLFLEVRRVRDESHDRHVLEELFTGVDAREGEDEGEGAPPPLAGSGIVYAQTVRAATETAEWLQGWGIAAEAYHGRLPKRERERRQDAFMDGSIQVIAATNAFGLGIDKPDVRFVIHRDIPPTLESYYQEAGRAGRDGDEARCVLIYRIGDVGRAAFFAGGSGLETDDVRRTVAALAGGFAMTRTALADAAGLGRARVARLVPILKEQGILREQRGRLTLARPDVDPASVSLEREERRLAYDASRLQMMRAYAETDDCRRRFILNYLGEEYDPANCRMCDGHTGPAGDVEATDDAPFRHGDDVHHAEWGPGTVQRITDDRVVVFFENEGYKTLDLELVAERGLLTDGAADPA